MKVRTDFVTNSSSSSFILGFTSANKQDIIQELVAGFPECYLEVAPTVIKDVLDADILDADEALQLMKDGMRPFANWEEEDNYRLRTNCSYCKAYKHMATEEGRSQVEQRLESMIGKYRDQMTSKSAFVEVEYGDDDGSYFADLEHRIMPEVASTICRISHH